MRHLMAAALGSLMLLAAGPALAKVCYKCKDSKPVPYVCANKDTFVARKNARKIGCNWSSYSSTCKCGRWVTSKNARSMSFADYIIALFSSPRGPSR